MKKTLDLQPEREKKTGRQAKASRLALLSTEDCGVLKQNLLF